MSPRKLGSRKYLIYCNILYVVIHLLLQIEIKQKIQLCISLFEV